MRRAAGLCFSTYPQIAAAVLLLLSGSECNTVVITLAPADEAFGMMKRAMNSWKASSCKEGIDGLGLRFADESLNDSQTSNCL